MAARAFCPFCACILPDFGTMPGRTAMAANQDTAPAGLAPAPAKGGAAGPAARPRQASSGKGTRNEAEGERRSHSAAREAVLAEAEAAGGGPAADEAGIGKTPGPEAGDDRVAAAAADAPAKPSRAMFICPCCHAKYVTSGKSIGRLVKCRRCETVFTAAPVNGSLPAGASSNTGRLPRLGVEEPAVATAARTAHSRHARHENALLYALLITAIAMMLAGGLILPGFNLGATAEQAFWIAGAGLLSAGLAWHFLAGRSG